MQGLEGVIERRIHGYLNYIEGFMHLNQRYDIWIRIGKKSFQKGLNSFEPIGKVLYRLFKSELPIIEKVQITFVTDPAKLEEMTPEAMQAYESRDAKARGLKDAKSTHSTDVHSANHSHQATSALSHHKDTATAAQSAGLTAKPQQALIPKGPVFAIPRGEMINEEKGEFTGVNEAAKKRTMGEVNQVWLYTAFDHPHTSCGCFEAVTFYIPEVDGLGVVQQKLQRCSSKRLTIQHHRRLSGRRTTNRRIPRNVHRIHAKQEILCSRRWMEPHCLGTKRSQRKSKRLHTQQNVVDKIATEEDAKNVDELKAFLKAKNHPVVAKWEAEEAPAAEAQAIQVNEEAAGTMMPVATCSSMPIMAGGFKIILKDAKIYANKVIITTVKDSKDNKDKR